jgi:hypothetical protein
MGSHYKAIQASRRATLAPLEMEIFLFQVFIFIAKPERFTTRSLKPSTAARNGIDALALANCYGTMVHNSPPARPRLATL